MSAITQPEQFAVFIYNQSKKTDLLIQDSNIQLAGLQGEEAQWRQVHALYAERGDLIKAEAAQREIASIQVERSHYIQQADHLVTIRGIVEELSTLPEVRPHLIRLEEAHKSVDIDWRQLK